MDGNFEFVFDVAIFWSLSGYFSAVRPLYMQNDLGTQQDKGAQSREKPKA